MNALAIMFALSVAWQAPARPEVGAAPAFKAPRVERTELANGLRVARARFGSTPITRVELVIRAGLSDEGAGGAGVAESVGDYLLAGTRTQTGADLAKRISGLGVLGGDLSVAVGAYETVIAADVLSSSVPALLRVLADIVQAPAFQENELARITENRVRRAAGSRTQVGNIAALRANSLLFPNHPLDRVPAEVELRALTLDKLRAFHQRNYVASRARLYVVGIFDEAAVDAALRSAFTNWQRGQPAPPLPAGSESAVAGDAAQPTIHLVHREGGTQARVHVAARIPDQSHPDHIVLNQLNILMGSVQTSRIIANVREKHGYSYNVSSRLNRRPGSSQWVVTADVARDVTGAALREIVNEITRLHTEPPTPDEIQRYQRFSAGGLIFENSTARGVVESLRWVDLYNADPTYFTDFVRHVFGVQPADFPRVIGKYLPLNGLAIVVVGDSAVIKKQLAQLGRVVE